MDLLFAQTAVGVNIANNQAFLDWTVAEWESTEIYEKYGVPFPGFSQEVLDMFVPSEGRSPIVRRPQLEEAMDVLIEFLVHWGLREKVQVDDDWVDLDFSECYEETANLGKYYNAWSRHLTGPNEYVQWLQRGELVLEIQDWLWSQEN